ncbi:hypothetical protein IEQ34_021730 [Dendrobium chrysotoxum]|uniref:DNA polymerase alpha subunit B n=1 Tax=Dendrobium chrysotoxum TaxID=161865 RepID=A0AAV7G6Q5_DENCH|nr:hypothetical protein IEQ34_021730 [Dendrobium chrysotoxum]
MEDDQLASDPAPVQQSVLLGEPTQPVDMQEGTSSSAGDCSDASLGSPKTGEQPTRWSDLEVEPSRHEQQPSAQIMFGCCTIDIVKQLSSEELSRNSIDVSGDRIRRLAMHLLNQHSFYPLYPPSISVPLDLSLAPEALEIPCTPDVLLLPSDLAPFIKVLNYESSGEETVSCMCINPGRLAKGIGGGTFVELNYNEDSNNSYASIIRI